MSATPVSPHPAEAPPEEVQTRGASNQTGQLPHSAAAGCARAAARFEAIASESKEPDVVVMALAGLEDAGRFVPDAMRQAARDEVAR